MALQGVLLELVLAVSVMLITATLVIVGPGRFTSAIHDYRSRLQQSILPLAVLASVLLLRWSTQDIMPRLQFRVLGSNITPYIDRVERAIFSENPVIVLQSLETDVLTSFFVFIYLYGYAFLLLFPFVAYFSLRNTETFNSLVVAFTANYAIGLFCYVLFIAYGPRNLLALDVVPILYEAYPQSRYLTNEVNQNTNVFPSLHTSLSVTVFLFAWLTRDKYPLWVPLSGFLAVSVTVSTMYLGIHWLSDVVAGIVLAVVSVYIGVNYTIEGLGRSLKYYLDTRFRRVVDKQ